MNQLKGLGVLDWWAFHVGLSVKKIVELLILVALECYVIWGEIVGLGYHCI